MTNDHRKRHSPGPGLGGSPLCPPGTALARREPPMKPPATLLTCGARIRVTPRLLAAAGETGSGPLRQSVQCPLAVHDRGPHWGILRDAAGTQPQAWTIWSRPVGTTALTPHTLPACPHTPDCRLFADNPGPCPPHFDTTLREDPARPVLVETALKTLTAHAGTGPTGDGTSEAEQAAHDAALLTWDELRARPRIVRDLPESDLAALHRLISRSASVPALDPAGVQEFVREVTEVTRLWIPGAVGRLPHGASAAFWLNILELLPPVWQAAVLSDRPEQILPPEQSPQRLALVTGPGPRIVFHEVLEHARRQAAIGQDPPTPVPDREFGGYRKQDHRLGADLAGRLACLPHGWRVDAVRRITRGTPTLTAVSEPAQAINILRGYGIRLAWNAATPTAHDPGGPPGHHPVTGT